MAYSSPEEIPRAFELTSVHDLSPERFKTELARTLADTAIERDWFEGREDEAVQSDYDAAVAILNGDLVHVLASKGIVPIKRLSNWDPSRSDPSHPFHYSPPYLRPEAAAVLADMGSSWAAAYQGSTEYSLAVTSMLRSLDYQREISQRSNKLTVPPGVGNSSHVYGWAFDIDGCGLYFHGAESSPITVNPRVPELYDQHRGEVHKAQIALEGVLSALREQGKINVVEELPGTKDRCHHVCVKPT